MISPIDYIRNAVWLMRSTAALLLVVFNFVFFFSPTVLALEEQLTDEERYQNKIDEIFETTPDQKLAYRLQKLKESVTLELSGKVVDRVQKSSKEGLLDKVISFFSSDAVINKSELEEISALKSSIEFAYAEAMLGFEQEAEILNNPKVPELARERYQAAKAEVTGKFDQLIEKLNVLLTQEDGDDQQQALNDLIQLLNESQFKKTHTAEDPNKLPWGTPENKARKPAETLSELSANIGVDAYPASMQLASAVIPMGAVLSSLKDFEKPGASELAPTMDAQITPEIQALADQLNNNVVEIYTWVHNKILFVPSHGSLQGAQMTLDTKRGNAMDTASLTIALLRASNIPARYVYGTVEIPAEKIMNWVGGAKNANAAGALLGQGGIPNVAIVSGGKIKSFRLEHVWAEAYVDFEPSRGLKNGSRDNWIPLDTSFKQYEFTEGEDLGQTVPFDADALISEMQANSMVNNDGWVQGVPQENLEQAINSYQQELTDYIKTQNPDATVGEVLGLKDVKVVEPKPLSSGLPYKHIVTSNTFSEVPNNLRYKFKYTLSTSENGYLSSPFISVVEPTVKLAGKKLGLSFAPATENDEQIIASYLPEPDPVTGEIDPDSLSDTLPGYTINMKAEFHINNDLKSSGIAGSMGSELHESLGYWSPVYGWELSSNKITAGEYQAIGLDLQGTDAAYAAKIQSGLEETKAKLDSDDLDQIDSLTKQELVGDLLQATIFSYFALNNLQDDIAAQQSGMISYRMPSYGKFSTALSTSYWFGMPRNVSASGLVMDVDRVSNSKVDKENNTTKRLAFDKMVGNRYSAMEHQVPELLYSKEDEPAEGISAIKAIALASAEGQKIWTIKQGNLSVALQNINLPNDVMTEIRNAVNNGKIVTTHEQPLSFYGSQQYGYIILDPNTGAGAYKIGSGANGGFLKKLDDLILKGQFWLGFFKGLKKKNLVTKAITKSLGQIVTVFTNAYKFLTECKDLSLALMLTLVFTLMSVAIAIALFFVAGPLAFPLSIGLAYVEDYLADLVIAKGC
ncbi:transglutaminase family protein [Bacterioplanoides sp. SCSIO 12839]|uniref:transglutaminase-like domain-containing protein n=1 Tax=Bacterioplanoides sp. SCSIO 12839 TaxID=2829569 RepID=UPI0021030654|nr:transglutaminase family protein [Bacterioplanoides sp. SCSIO 12839]UTW47587.1 transglutaminase family protein [Bacterioplanoides sp. SCSIO 12839]